MVLKQCDRSKTKKGVPRPNTKSLSDETKSVLYDISDYETWQKNE